MSNSTINFFWFFYLYEIIINIVATETILGVNEKEEENVLFSARLYLYVGKFVLHGNVIVHGDDDVHFS